MRSQNENLCSKLTMRRMGSNSNCAHNLVPVYLNVYDLTPMNGYIYWFGIGVFHSGIEAHGVEYGFGAHEYSTTGVFEVEPRKCPGFTFRRAVLLGTTGLNAQEFREFIEDLAGNYSGDSYDLMLKNCNHFTNEVSMRLTRHGIPRWVNRLARLGLCSLASCIFCYRLRVQSVIRF
ncbi:hypothetical protein O6H91_11G086200 [Diphasiastrum complanatum]|uniref:Uncharacterized protein n=2 Tax=Diphasiastrum complanatum TaxID=34168 RepID=A0ACC2CAH3_DIPCM|nr:hypothetical protein O6H91_11G073600 [Diphasiastrum complanatum]KAJ7539305.1 hypothetical protein O6H91_11G086200 [Diphasiastrum complanatum]